MRTGNVLISDSYAIAVSALLHVILHIHSGDSCHKDFCP